jgi:hypothetical protein
LVNLRKSIPFKNNFDIWQNKARTTRWKLKVWNTNFNKNIKKHIANMYEGHDNVDRKSEILCLYT